MVVVIDLTFAEFIKTLSLYEHINRAPLKFLEEAQASES